MRMKVLATMFAVSAVSMIAGAKDTTWIGGESGYISDASNWDNGVPAGGDKVIFNKSVSLSNNTSEATFLMGEGGLEFSIAANCTVTDRVSYSGVGDLKLTGGGVWNFFGGIKVGSSYSVGLFTGNVEVVKLTIPTAEKAKHLAKLLANMAELVAGIEVEDTAGFVGLISELF